VGTSVRRGKCMERAPYAEQMHQWIAAIGHEQRTQQSQEVRHLWCYSEIWFCRSVFPKWQLQSPARRWAGLRMPTACMLAVHVCMTDCHERVWSWHLQVAHRSNATGNASAAAKHNVHELDFESISFGVSAVNPDTTLLPRHIENSARQAFSIMTILVYPIWKFSMYGSMLLCWGRARARREVLVTYRKGSIH